MIRSFLKNQQSEKPRNLNKSEYFMTNEILKMFMKKTSLKILTYNLENYNGIQIPNNATITNLPGARDCLKDISELSCSNDVHSRFFFQLSQVCHNIQSLKILYRKRHVSYDGLKTLISSQNSLKNLLVNQFMMV